MPDDAAPDPRIERQERRKDLEAAIQARKDLGPEYEAALVDSFVDSISSEIDRRVAAASPSKKARRAEREADQQGFVIALVSLGTGIPISAIAGGIAEGPGLVVAWAGIAAVNAAAALGRRHRH